MTKRPRSEPGPRPVAVAAVLVLLALQLIAPSGASGAPAPQHAGTDAAAPPNPNGRATFGIGPALKGQPDPHRPYFNFTVTPGARLTDHVIVNNYSTSALTLAVYATDAFNETNGDFALLDPGTRPKDAGSWISVATPRSGGTVTIAARSKTVLPVAVRIPANATPGDHAAGVVASLTAVSKNSTGANVRLIQRVGARVFIRVTGPLHPKLSVERLHARYTNNWNPIGSGTAVVTYRISNTGNVKVGVQQRVSVRGLLGTTARVSPATVPLLLPGNHIDVRAVVPDVAPEIWESASVRLAPLFFPGDARTGPSGWSATTHFWAVPWILLAILAAALLAGAAWWWRRRRRARPAAPPAAGEAAHREPVRTRS